MVFLHSTGQFSITAFFSFLPKKRIKFEPQQSNKSFGASDGYFNSRSTLYRLLEERRKDVLVILFKTILGGR